MAFAHPTDAYTASDVASMTPEVWSDIVNEPNFPKAVLSNFFTDLSDYMSDGGDIVHVPNIFTNTFTVSTQSTEANGVVDQSVASVDTTLTVNLHKYVAFIMGDMTIRQLATKYSLNEAYAREAKNLLTNALEASLAGLWSSLSTNSVGDTATTLSEAELRDAVNALDSLDYDLTETAFFVHPYVFWTQLQGIAKLYTYDTSGMAPVMTGNFGPFDYSRGLRGQVFGQPIFVTTNIVSGLQTYRNLFAHKSAFGYAIQTPGIKDESGAGGRIRVQSAYELRNLGMLTVVDMIYGVAVLREPAAVVVNANNTLKTS